MVYDHGVLATCCCFSLSISIPTFATRLFNWIAVDPSLDSLIIWVSSLLEVSFRVGLTLCIYCTFAYQAFDL